MKANGGPKIHKKDTQERICELSFALSLPDESAYFLIIVSRIGMEEEAIGINVQPINKACQNSLENEKLMLASMMPKREIVSIRLLDIPLSIKFVSLWLTSTVNNAVNVV